MIPNKPKFSVVVPVFNSEKTIEDCLRSIFNNDYPNFKVIVVDDCSTDNSPALIKKFDCLLVRNDKNKGPAVVRNMGANLAQGDIILFVDSDVMLKNNFLESVAARFDACRNIGAISGVYSRRVFKETLINRYRTLQLHFWNVSTAGLSSSVFEVQCGAVLKDVFVRAGGFNTVYNGADVEDWDLGYRILEISQIYRDRTLDCDHHFDLRLSNLLRNIFRRSKLWMQNLVLSGRQAGNTFINKGRISGAFLAALSLLLFICGIFYHPLFNLCALAFLFSNICDFRFIVFLFKESGLGYLIPLICVHYLVNVTYAFGAATGILSNITIRCKKKVSDSIRRGIKTYYLTKSIVSGMPLYLILFITSRCNAKCRMCFYWQNTDDYKNRTELSLSEIEKLSRNFKSLLQLTISGGEPFLRDDISEICNIFTRNCGLRFITIPTNGLLPDKIEANVKKILTQSRPKYLRITLSLDGVGDVHEDVRQVKGSFEKVLETYKRLSDLRNSHKNMGIEVTTVLSSYNRGKVDGLVDYVKNNLEIDKHNLLFVRGNVKEINAKNVSLGEYKKLVRQMNLTYPDERRNLWSWAFKAIYKYNNDSVERILETGKMSIPCLAGQRLLVIDDQGLVLPCEILNKSLGDLRENNFNLYEVMNSEKAREIYRHIKDKKCACTFECAIHASIIFNWRCWFRVLSCGLRS